MAHLNFSSRFKQGINLIAATEVNLQCHSQGYRAIGERWQSPQQGQNAAEECIRQRPKYHKQREQQTPRLVRLPGTVPAGTISSSAKFENLVTVALLFLFGN